MVWFVLVLFISLFEKKMAEKTTAGRNSREKDIAGKRYSGEKV